jgi:DNA-binding transcriptional LysR family regulator
LGQKVIYAPKLATAINMFEAGVGIGYVPHHRIRQGLDDGRVLKKAIVEHKQPTQLFYAWHANQKDCCRISSDISLRFFWSNVEKNG